MNELAPAPLELLDTTGAPRFGAFAGRIENASFNALAGPWRRDGMSRVFSEKRWHYASISSPTIAMAAAVIRLGYMGSAFLYVFDRVEKRMLANRNWLLPAPLVTVSETPARAQAVMRSARSRLAIDASPTFGRISASLSGDVDVEVALDPARAPPPLTLVCPVPGGAFNLTQKTSCVHAEGEVRVGAKVFRLRDAVGAFDYTHGLLARDTTWLWASASGPLADGTLVGLNLVSGFNEGGAQSENVVWVGDRLIPVGTAQFEHDRKDPLAPWRVRTSDGAVDLVFTPEGVRSEDTDLKVVASQYAQPVGSFSGTVRDASGKTLRVERLPGVTEWHRARW